MDAHLSTIAPAAALDHLDWLEAEAIHILREVAGQCANPVLLFSGGKDSICLLRLAEKANDLLLGEPLFHARSPFGKRTLLSSRWHCLRGAGQRPNGTDAHSVADLGAGHRMVRAPKSCESLSPNHALNTDVPSAALRACLGPPVSLVR